MNFDELMELYATNPDEFLKHKNDIIEETISSAPKEQQQRLRAIQWKIDQELDSMVGQTNRLNRMVEMFWKDGVKKLQEATNMLSDPTQELPQKNSADVIPFNKKD